MVPDVVVPVSAADTVEINTRERAAKAVKENRVINTIKIKKY
jgi:hypothetical protein